jgi:hypothetical protein
MRGAYRAFAGLIALGVLVQAAAIALGVFLLGEYIDDGNTVTTQSFEDGGDALNAGLMLHGMNGVMIMPLIGLVFFIISFFAKVPGGVKWAGFTFLAIIVQVFLGLFAHEVPALGAVHGINAVVVLGLAIVAVRRATAPAAAEPATAPGATAAV